jgi:hypothetical protein
LTKVFASSSTSPFPERELQLLEVEAGIKAAEAESKAEGPKNLPLSPGLADGSALQETVRQVRREIKKSSNWQVLPPIWEGQLLEASAAAAATDSESTKQSGEGLTLDLLSSGVTYALTLCSDVVQQLAKFEERLKQVEESSGRISTEVTACFHRTNLLREMMEMEQGVRSQDTVRLQASIQQASERVDHMQLEIEGRQSDLAKILTGNCQMLASALDKRAHKLDGDVAQLQKRLDERDRLDPVSNLAAARRQQGPSVNSRADRRDASPPLLRPSPAMPGLVLPPNSTPRVSRSSSPKRTASANNPTSSPKGAASPRRGGMDTPRAQRFAGDATPIVPTERPQLNMISVPSSSKTHLGKGSRMLSGRQGEAASQQPRLPSYQDDRTSAASQPRRPTPDADHRHADLVPPRERSNGFTWKCRPHSTLLCKVTTEQEPDDQEADFVTVNAASIYVDV